MIKLPPVLLGRMVYCTGILTCYPSVTPIGLTLGPTNPQSIDVAEETLGIRWQRFSLCSCYLYQHSHLRYLHETSQFRFAGLRNVPLLLLLDKSNRNPCLRLKS